MARTAGLHIGQRLGGKHCLVLDRYCLVVLADQVRAGKILVGSTRELRLLYGV